METYAFIEATKVPKDQPHTEDINDHDARALGHQGTLTLTLFVIDLSNL